MNTTNLMTWVRDFPGIFSCSLKSEAAASYAASVGPGWNELLRDLFTALAEMERDAPGTVRIVQVKEKFGLLRIYLAQGNPEAYALIDEASRVSGVTCEICGGPSTVRNRGGWLTTTCEGCYQP